LHSIGKYPLAIFLLALSLSGCGGSEKSSLVETINAKLSKDVECVRLPIQVPVDISNVGDDGALGILKNAGVIQEAQIVVDEKTGGSRSGYDFTKKGEELVVQPKRGSYFFGNFVGNYPCVRTGRYEVDSINAIDYGSNLEGQPIANVRTTLRFVPEDWISHTKTQEQWKKFWGEVKDREGSQVLVQLLKSGDEFFFIRAGKVQ